jgi:hypothetical protein
MGNEPPPGGVIGLMETTNTAQVGTEWQAQWQAHGQATPAAASPPPTCSPTPHPPHAPHPPGVQTSMVDTLDKMIRTFQVQHGPAGARCPHGCFALLLALKGSPGDEGGVGAVKRCSARHWRD